LSRPTTSKDIEEFEDEFVGAAAATATAPAPVDTVDVAPPTKTTEPTGEQSPTEQPEPTEETDPRPFSPRGGVPDPFNPPPSQ
jgi:hypothetical protein